LILIRFFDREREIDLRLGSGEGKKETIYLRRVIDQSQTLFSIGPSTLTARMEGKDQRTLVSFFKFP
jgi:hypothetical protein